MYGTESAFSLVTSCEEPRGSHGVTAGSKIKEDDDLKEEWLNFRRNITKVCLNYPLSS